MQTPVTLTVKDYRDILDLAHREYVSNAIKHKELFVCECYVTSFCGWLVSKGLTVIDGKIYQNETADKT